MFLDNLSVSLLQLCDTEKLSYERASERCGCSPKHFGNIVRRSSSPTLDVFEQICLGFHETPNQLLRIDLENNTFRTPMPVTEIHRYPPAHGSISFPVCPRCKCDLDREYLAYCSYCGQCLSWEQFKNAIVVIRS